MVTFGFRAASKQRKKPRQISVKKKICDDLSKISFHDVYTQIQTTSNNGVNILDFIMVLKKLVEVQQTTFVSNHIHKDLKRARECIFWTQCSWESLGKLTGRMLSFSMVLRSLVDPEGPTVRNTRLLCRVHIIYV